MRILYTIFIIVLGKDGGPIRLMRRLHGVILPNDKNASRMKRRCREAGCQLVDVVPTGGEAVET